MALILILDRADTGRWRRPHVKAVINDGYVLFCEKGYPDGTLIQTYWSGETGIDLSGVAQSLVAMGVGDDMRQEIAAEMQRIRAAKEHEEIKAKWRDAAKGRTDSH